MRFSDDNSELIRLRQPVTATVELDIAIGVTIFVVGALILSPLLFKLNLRDEPH
jgi:hypothetical protein